LLCRRGSRTPAINQLFIDASGEVQAAANLLADQREREAGRAHARLVQVVALARLSQAMREAAGMRSAHLERALGNLEASRDTYQAIDELGGRVEALWDRIVVGVAQLSGTSRLDDAREETQHTLMGEGRATYAAIALALRERTTPPLTLDEFRAWTGPMLARALLMRDAAFDVAGELAADMTREATISLWVAVATAVAALLASLGAVTVILYRVVRPLGELTEAIARLSRGDFAVSVSGRARRDELGAMACAVDMFKQSEVKIGTVRNSVYGGRSTVSRPWPR
jgi:HAMP domain-containing protein